MGEARFRDSLGNRALEEVAEAARQLGAVEATGARDLVERELFIPAFVNDPARSDDATIKSIDDLKKPSEKPEKPTEAAVSEEVEAAAEAEEAVAAAEEKKAE